MTTVRELIAELPPEKREADAAGITALGIELDHNIEDIDEAQRCGSGNSSYAVAPSLGSRSRRSGPRRRRSGGVREEQTTNTSPSQPAGEPTGSRSIPSRFGFVSRRTPRCDGR